jgi:hypothetical protein
MITDEPLSYFPNLSIQHVMLSGAGASACQPIPPIRWPPLSLRPPLTPSHHAQFRPSLSRQHRNIFQKVPIQIVKINRHRRHPRQHHRLLRRPARQIKRRDPRPAKLSNRRQHILHRYFEGRVQTHPLRSATRLPKTEHRLSRRAHPEERNVPLAKSCGQRQAQHVPVNAIDRSRSLTVRWVSKSPRMLIALDSVINLIYIFTYLHLKNL